MLALATKVLNDYSKMLAQLEPSNLGFADSFLPHSKAVIREATKTALQHLGNAEPTLREALIRGYVYLEQFVPDAQAETLMLAAMPGEVATEADGQEAALIVADIKQRMEAALREVSTLV
jgi:hypothetical protein